MAPGLQPSAQPSQPFDRDSLAPILDISTFDRPGGFSRKSSSDFSQTSHADPSVANQHGISQLRDILAKIHTASPFKKNAIMQTALDVSQEHSLWNANVSPIAQVNESIHADEASPQEVGALYCSFQSENITDTIDHEDGGGGPNMRLIHH